MSGRLRILIAVGVSGVVAAARTATAQGYPFSQRTEVVQHVAFTDITIRYGRPVARGRTLFADSGGVVTWGGIWHPGADSATRLVTSRDIEIEGRRLPAGEYSLWLIPRSAQPWTVIFSRAAHVFHTPYPGESHDALRLDVNAERGAHMESMMIYFPSVARDQAVLRVHWGEVVLPLHVKAPYRPPEYR